MTPYMSKIFTIIGGTVFFMIAIGVLGFVVFQIRDFYRDTRKNYMREKYYTCVSCGVDYTLKSKNATAPARYCPYCSSQAVISKD
jgi:DNA-directed RNA polymerase subunit RPC12/RpoP